MADWGADVIKVEPAGGDPQRAVFGSVGLDGSMPVPPFEVDNRGKRSMVLDLRGRVFTHAQSLSLAFHEQYTSGRVISRLTSDLDSLNELADEGLEGLISGVLSVVALVALAAIPRAALLPRERAPRAKGQIAEALASGALKGDMELMMKRFELIYVQRTTSSSTRCSTKHSASAKRVVTSCKKPGSVSAPSPGSSASADPSASDHAGSGRDARILIRSDLTERGPMDLTIFDKISERAHASSLLASLR